MKTHKDRGKSIPMVENLQVEEGVWVPITPSKPPQVPHFRPPYEVEVSEMETLLAGSSKPQQFFSTASLGNTCSNNNSHLLGLNQGGNIDIQHIENNGNHVEGYMPWNSQGLSTKYASQLPQPPQLGAVSDFPFLRQWEATNPVRKNNVGVIGDGEDSYSHLTSFTDLLAMNDSGIGNVAFYQDWNASHSAVDTSFNGIGMFSNQNDSYQLNQQMRGIYGEDMQYCGSLHQYQSLCDVNSSQMNTNARISVFAPVTPDSRWKPDSMGLGSTPLDTCNQSSLEQNEVQEQDIDAAKINLQNVFDGAPNTDVLSPDKVSMAVESHDPEKNCDQVLDLNKTPQKKPRRRRYQPKVISEKKPRKTPKPKTPKPTEVKETTRVKKKYVRKNKVDTNSTPIPSEVGESKPTEVHETGDTKEAETAVKSCRKSLNFDLNGQAESNLPPMPNEDAHAEVQGKCDIEKNQNSHSRNDREAVELVVQASRSRGGIAYDLNCVLNQELEEYLSRSTKDCLDNSRLGQDIPFKRRESPPHTLSGNNPEILSRSDAPHPAESPSSSPCASLSKQKHRIGSKRHNPDVGNMDVVIPTQCAFQQLNHALDANIGEHQNSPLPKTCKKKKTEKAQSPHVPSTSSTAPLGDPKHVVSASNHPRVDPSASKYYCCIPSPLGNDAVTSIDHNSVFMKSNQNMIELTNTWADLARLKNSKDTTTRVRDLAQLMGISSSQSAKSGPKGPHKKKVDISGDANTEVGITSFKRAKPGPKGPCKKNIDISGDANTEVGITSFQRAKPGPKGPRKKKTDNSGDANTETLATSSTANPRSKRRAKKQKSGNPVSGSFSVLTWERSICSIEEITKWMKELDISKKSCRTETVDRIQGLLQEPNNALQEQNALVPYHASEQQQIALVPYHASEHKQIALVPYHANEQVQNALVIYGRDGTMVPFEGPFDPVRKRRQRAKVDLDDETTKVWNLLLENINNEGIDGTDEDKTKWWENERSIFRGRVDSFIARMRLVQGDRRFTPWKGSVLDSVIGVFLTQNVSDHLSSSAFMSMAAHFPLKSEGSEITLSEESATVLVEEPDICVIELEESISCNEKTINQQILTSNSRIIHDIDHIEEKEVVNSKELTKRAPGSLIPKDYSSEGSQKNPSSTVSNANSQTTENETASVLGDDRAKDDATSSQHSVMSSQNSTNSPNLHTVEMMSFFSENDSRTQPLATSCQSNYIDSSTSFLELLKMAESPLHEYYNRTQQDSLECMNHDRKGFPEAQGTGSSNNLLNLSYQFPHTKGFEILEIYSKSTSRKDENSTPAEQSNLTTESTVHLTQEKSSDNIPRSFTENMSCYVLEGEKTILYGQTSSAWRSTNISQVNADVTESTTVFDRSCYDQKEVEQVHASASKSQKGKAGTKKNEKFDWDSLRREAQPNGQKKVRPANFRDSLDWEAVRHADVTEIAEVIKERGMNNKLAERIKALLDRLVKEHGSVDMEWVRDVPPDKAKEYLLSFRGLGLKSVECVRLLTLHHLAFPVDTNVGRIAVRLGWVPLQPLPESLQLHLLELYPILESIQKYLWPRLCKLDQKTLYELHYHLITFGKVFCTKKQPNCNACPLRAECRHFASAFASARFTLPAPEEKRILPSNATFSTPARSQAGSNLLPLPPALSNQQSQNNPRSVISVPTIEDSPSALVLPLAQTISHSERPSQTTNLEPIVEVPASPEPEQEQTIEDIEDAFYEDPDEIPTITLNLQELSQTIQNYTQTGESTALVALTPEAASIPTPRLKNINQLRTEHHVYELPDTHPLLKGLDKREHDDPCSYLLAIWTPGETADSIQPPERRCSSEDPSMMCNEETCSYCNSLREVNSQIVRGTLLIPCRTAMRGSFPLNGTYFQVNEVFADHDSSLSPIAVPRSWLWNLPRRTVYFGTSIPSIFKGLTTEEIQHCFWRGFVCVRGFDQKTRAPRPLMARLHFPASRMKSRAKGKAYDE